MSTIKELRENLFNASFGVAKNAWLKVFLVYVVQTVITIILFIPFFGVLFGGDFVSIFENINDPVAMQQQSEMIAQNMIGAMQGMSLMIFFVIVVMIFLTSWVYKFLILIIDNSIKNNGLTFMELLKNSFSKKILTIAGVSLIIGILFIVLEIIFAIVFGLLGSIFGSIGVMILLGIIAAILFLGILMRLSLVYTSIVLGDMGAMDALTYSFKEIDMKTGIKYGLISLLAIIVIYALLFVIMIPFALIVQKLGMGGIVLLQIVMVFVGAFMIAYITSLFVGLYYKHSENEDENVEMNIEDHLIL